MCAMDDDEFPLHKSKTTLGSVFRTGPFFHKLTNGRNHKWVRITVRNPIGPSQYTQYVLNYIVPYGLNAQKVPAASLCLRCGICVPCTGPDERDFDCNDVIVRKIQTS